MKTLLTSCLGAFVATLVAGVSTHAAAQPYECGDCNLSGQQTHEFGINFVDGGGFRVTCLSFEEGNDECHDEALAGHCTANHYETCSGGADLEQLLADLPELARNEPTLDLIAKHPRLQYNRSRDALQVLDCSGKLVVAHVPIRRERAGAP